MKKEKRREPSIKSEVFTEEETRKFYNEHDAFYRSFWDQGGSLHWGLYNSNIPFECTSKEFIEACIKLNELMGQKLQISKDSFILDAGCGNGTTSLWIANRYPGCKIFGIDLSSTRINNANQLLTKQTNEIQNRVKFFTGSLTDLPFEDDLFTHIISQATLYHVNKRIEALQEIRRVLKPQGLFVFDDLLKPHATISANAKKFVYDRLLFDTDFNFISYQETLNSIGFNVVYAEDLSESLLKSYTYLCKKTKSIYEEDEIKNEEYKTLSIAYDHTVEAIRSQDLGWGFFVSKKNDLHE